MRTVAVQTSNLQASAAAKSSPAALLETLKGQLGFNWLIIDLNCQATTLTPSDSQASSIQVGDLLSRTAAKETRNKTLHPLSES